MNLACYFKWLKCYKHSSDQLSAQAAANLHNGNIGWTTLTFCRHAGTVDVGWGKRKVEGPGGASSALTLQPPVSDLDEQSLAKELLINARFRVARRHPGAFPQVGFALRHGRGGGPCSLPTSAVDANG